MKILAETEVTRLLCDGKSHWGETKNSGNRWKLCACDCKRWDEIAKRAEVGP